MFNPLNFFKKKPIEQPASLDQALGPVVEKQSIIDDIVIHTMPERFRHQPVKAGGAKTTGLLIIGGGIVILILVSAGLYFYLFKKPEVIVKPEPLAAEVTPVEGNQTQPEVIENTTVEGTLPATATPLGGVITPINSGLPAPTATSTPETIESGLTVGLTPGLDSDNDGLTDLEESLLKTGTSTPDTDGDGYSDGAEILSLYDPAGPGKLAANANFALYENKTFNYTVLYPGAWQMAVNGGDDSIMFKTADNQFFQIIVQPNSGQQSLDQWYMDQLDATKVNEADRVSNSSWQGIKSPDGLTLYLTDFELKYIFTLAYNPGENNILEYINIFNMIIKSFTIPLNQELAP